MKRLFGNNRSIAILAAAFVGLFLFTLVVSALPQLHERIHQTGSTHECAVTLLTSGNYQHASLAAICVAPPAPPKSFALTPDRFQLVSAHLEFSLLEHAPPVNS